MISNGYKCTCLAGFTGNDCEGKNQLINENNGDV